MSEEYVRIKIKEALKSSDNDKHAAQKLLVTMAVRDPVLLLGLTKSNLKGIIAAQIDAALRPAKKVAMTGRANFTKSDADAMIALRAPNEKRSRVAVPPPKTSMRQASVMQQIAAAFGKKGKK